MTPNSKGQLLWDLFGKVIFKAFYFGVCFDHLNISRDLVEEFFFLLKVKVSAWHGKLSEIKKK